MKISAHGASDLGLKRTINEDNYKLCHNLRLFLVADGMGGHIAGEVASKLAVDVIAEAVQLELDSLSDNEYTLLHPGQLLEKAIQLSNKKILETARKRAELEGMGTTIVAVMAHNKTLHIASVGDSRIYRVRNGEGRQLTSDHSWVNMQVRLGYMTSEEAKFHPMRNVITRALGTQRDVEVDIMAHLIRPDDVIVLCSDGLTNYVGAEEITRIVEQRRSGTHIELEQSAEDMIQLANDRGGDDNITVVILHFESGDDLGDADIPLHEDWTGSDHDTEVIPKNEIRDRLRRKRFPQRPP